MHRPKSDRSRCI